MKGETVATPKVHAIRTTRARILDAAARLFATKGFHLTSIDEIAQEAGVAKGSVYYHFPGKDQLLVSVIQEGVRLIQETVEERQEGVTDPLERLLIVLDTTFDVIMEYQEIARFALLGGCEGVARDVKTQIDQAREAFEADIEARVREIVGDRWDSTMMARVLFGALEGAVRAVSLRPRAARIAARRSPLSKEYQEAKRILRAVCAKTLAG